MERQNIILIGFMGAGKTSVGFELADRYHKTLIDLDQLIEKRAGITISQIFKTQGEEAFRRLETQVLEELLEYAEGELISVGGGLPMREENRVMLRKLGTVIYLRIKPETVCRRLQGDGTRPLLQGDDVEERVNALLAIRGPVYEEGAHWVIEADDKTIGQIAEEIMRGMI